MVQRQVPENNIAQDRVLSTAPSGLDPQYSIGQGSQDQTFVAARVWTFGLNLKL